MPPGNARVVIAHVSNFVFSYAPGLLVISAIILLFAYLRNRRLTGTQVYLAVSAPGLVITLAYVLNLYLALGFGTLGIATLIGVIFFPAIWIFPLVTVYAARLIYLQKIGHSPPSGISSLTIVGSVVLVALYVATTAMASAIEGP